MAVLLIQHRVPDFTSWKQVFDSDPVGRGRLGVTGYRIYRAADDPEYVVYELEFATAEEAASFAQEPALREAQRRYRAESPTARVLEEVESVTL